MGNPIQFDTQNSDFDNCINEANIAALNNRYLENFSTYEGRRKVILWSPSLQLSASQRVECRAI